MNEKFLGELARRLRARGIEPGEAAETGLPVLSEGRQVLWVAPKGTVFLEPGAADDPDAHRLYDIVAGSAAEVWEYASALSCAPPLKAEGLHEGFRLLAEFNGVVLAGRELHPDRGCQFVTWRRTADRAGVVHGHYYEDGYAEAKLDFACRSGLAALDRQFSDEQLTEIYRCVYEMLDRGCHMARERSETLTKVLAQISRSVDGLEAQVERSIQQEQTAEQTDEWEMSP